MKKIITITMIIGGMSAFGQAPANDECSGATLSPINGTCIPGTTINANDSWAGTVGCQSGYAHPDVWYYFYATGSSMAINITEGTMTGNIEFVLVSAAANCVNMTIEGSICGASPLSDTINTLQIGTLYYYTLSSSGSPGTFTSCITNYSQVPLAGQDCATAAILCNDNSFAQAASSAGYGAQEVTSANSCFGIGGERQSKWFKFTVGCSGTLEFNIHPTVSTNDYDWAIWNVTSAINCSSKGNAIACNWSGCQGSTGLSSCIASEPGANNIGTGCGSTYSAFANSTFGNSNPIMVTAGNTYALLVDNYSASNNGFTLTFGGACSGGTAKIGPDANFTYTNPTCSSFSFNKTCSTSNSTFLWQFGDGTTSTLENPNHTYVTSDTFSVSLNVTDALGCTSTFSRLIPVINLSHYSTAYDSISNNFTLTVDSATAYLATDYHWNFGDGATSTIPNPSHTYTVDTTYNVCMKIVTSTGDSCEYCHIIGKDYLENIIRNAGFTINVNNPTSTVGIYPIKNLQSAISIFPNPFTSKTTIIFSEVQKNSTIKIMDVLGKEIKQIKFTGKELIIEKGMMKEGVYFLQLIDEKKNISNKKIIIQ